MADPEQSLADHKATTNHFAKGILVFEFFDVFFDTTTLVIAFKNHMGSTV